MSYLGIDLAKYGQDAYYETLNNITDDYYRLFKVV